jgi:hypothetical protein
VPSCKPAHRPSPYRLVESTGIGHLLIKPNSLLPYRTNSFVSYRRRIAGGVGPATRTFLNGRSPSHTRSSALALLTIAKENTLPFRRAPQSTAASPAQQLRLPLCGADQEEFRSDAVGSHRNTCLVGRRSKRQRTAASVPVCQGRLAPGSSLRYAAVHQATTGPQLSGIS